MKLAKWTLLIVGFFLALWLLWQIELWSKEWKDLFFYQDNWIMFIFLVIMCFAVGMIIKKFYANSFKKLK